MAPPKSRKDYVSFDAYVDSILLKRDMQEGMFNIRSRISADTEQLMNLFRRYRTMLKREDAPEELTEKVEQYALDVYAVKAVGTRKEMVKVLEHLSDFNSFLQSDAGNGVNHYSRIMKLAEATGFDMDVVQRGLRAFSEGVELGLELDPQQVRSGPEYAQYVVDPLLPEEDPYVAGGGRKRDEKARPRPVNPVQKRGKPRQKIEEKPNQLFEIDTSSKPKPGRGRIDADELLLNEPFPAVKSERDLAVEGYRPAKEWLKQFQSTQDIYSPKQDRPGEYTAKPDWLLRILATRSLVNAKPSDTERLKKNIRMQDINRRAEELERLPEVKRFLQAMKTRPDLYESTVPIARTGHGSALEKWFRDYIAMNGLAPRDPLLQRYLPTAEHRVRLMQERLMYHAKTSEQRRDCLVHIIASRMAVGAKRGGITGMDKVLKNVPDSETYTKCCELAREGLSKVPPKKVAKLLTDAADGHGGRLMESFSKLTQITTQNWRDRLDEQPKNIERNSLLSL